MPEITNGRPVPVEEADPVGVADIAQRTGRPRTTIKKLVERGKLPEPRWPRARGDLWHWPDVEPVVTVPGRPGRPPKREAEQVILRVDPTLDRNRLRLDAIGTLGDYPTEGEVEELLSRIEELAQKAAREVHPRLHLDFASCHVSGPADLDLDTLDLDLAEIMRDAGETAADELGE